MAMVPLILGVVNMTRDSFSDGGLYLKPERALSHALQLLADGADILDLGPASSHPDSEHVSWQTEVQRTQAVLPALLERGATVSIDSCLPETQRFSMEKGVSFLNDIRGFPHVELYEELADSSCRLILMHSIQESTKASRTRFESSSIMDRIQSFFFDRTIALTRAGIARDRLILDPGMGFFLGSDPDTSVEVLRNIQGLKKEFNLPVLVGVSRKSFLGKITGSPVSQLGAATLAAEISVALRGADYIRTHDVKALKDALKVLQRIHV